MNCNGRWKGWQFSKPLPPCQLKSQTMVEINDIFPRYAEVKTTDRLFWTMNDIWHHLDSGSYWQIQASFLQYLDQISQANPGVQGTPNYTSIWYNRKIYSKCLTGPGRSLYFSGSRKQKDVVDVGMLAGWLAGWLMYLSIIQGQSTTTWPK